MVEKIGQLFIPLKVTEFQSFTIKRGPICSELKCAVSSNLKALSQLVTGFSWLTFYAVETLHNEPVGPPKSPIHHDVLKAWTFSWNIRVPSPGQI